MMKLSELIPWEELEKEFAEMWPDDGGAGRPAKPVRLMGRFVVVAIHVRFIR